MWKSENVCIVLLNRAAMKGTNFVDAKCPGGFLNDTQVWAWADGQISCQGLIKLIDHV